MVRGGGYLIPAYDVSCLQRHTAPSLNAPTHMKVGNCLGARDTGEMDLPGIHNPFRQTSSRRWRTHQQNQVISFAPQKAVSRYVQPSSKANPSRFGKYLHPADTRRTPSKPAAPITTLLFHNATKSSHARQFSTTKLPQDLLFFE